MPDDAPVTSTVEPAIRMESDGTMTPAPWMGRAAPAMEDTVHDLVIIGAGMAGCSAAHDARAAGLDVLVVESKDRIGGRMFTDHEFADAPVELGAEFIHTAEAETLPFTQDAGFALLRCNPADGYVMSYGGVRSPELYKDRSLRAIGDLLGDVTRFEGPDQTAAEFLAPRALEGAGRSMADQMLTIHPLGDLHELSMQGLRDDRVVDLELGIDHRVVVGYDELPKHLARDIDVRLGWRVAEMRWSNDHVTVVSTTGEELEARAAVCTLPVGVLKSGAVRFTPALPATKLAALNGLEMGAALKVLLHFEERFWPEDLTMLGCDGPVRLYWTPLYGRSEVPPVLTAYVGGYRARALSAVGEEAAARVCLDDLDRLFPETKPSRLVRSWKRVDWLTDPDTRGAYSFVRLGGAGSRAALAAADTGALFWAGDATTTTTIAAVVHAAYVTGKRAAVEAAAHLSR